MPLFDCKAQFILVFVTFHPIFRVETLPTVKLPAEAPEVNRMFVDAAVPVSVECQSLTFVQHSLFLCFITWFLFTVATLIKPPAILGSLVPPFPQRAHMEESIIEVLKYSQKDMDAAIAKVQEEVGLTELQSLILLKKLLDLKLKN